MQTFSASTGVERAHTMTTAHCCLCICIFAIGGCGGGGSNTSTPVPGTSQSPTLTGTLQKTDLPPPATLSATPANLPSFIAFESGQVRPLALSEDGRSLYAVNTPDNRLEVYSIGGATLRHVQSVPVGLEPVAVAVSGDQVWVVNHLSDSVSIVSLARSPYRVVRTLLVGDEPRDIVFAGPGMRRAFITTAHRGQNSDVEPQLTTSGLGRADVVVFSRDNPGAEPGGEPLATLTLFGDTPRALARNADGSRVYAAVFNSGNKTTVVRAIPTLDKAPPFTNIEGIPAPESAYILKFDGTNWVDEAGRHFDRQANLNLPDLDVFEIDTMGEVPRQVNEWAGVGTTLYNMAVSPVSGNLFVSNTEARNHVRFEGPGNNASTLRGNFVDSRLSLLGRDGSVVTQTLNPHIDRSRSIGTVAERELSLALPLEIAISSDGANLYMVAMGSNKIAIIPAETIGTDAFEPASQTHITVSGGGPTGIVLDEPRNQAYVLTRFDNGISIIDLASASEIAHVKMHNPEPPSVTAGRKFLYDATLTSSAGDSSCALCHVFADTDHLSWDLGNPDEVEMVNPFGPVPFTNPITGRFRVKQARFHPMKGPKGTQSLRGLANHGPLHWRGDRTGSDAAPGEALETAAFKEFNQTFTKLLGREVELTPNQIQAFADFALQISYPPNPIRGLDNRLTVDEQEGRRVYTNVFTSPGGTVGCNTCHVLDAANGRFGTAVNFTAVLGENEQDFKVPHFRNIYQKVGFFRQGSQPQIRGFGLSEPGSTAGLMGLINSGEFRFETNRQPEQLAAFIFAYDSLLAPVVGQQVTLSSGSPSATDQRIDLLFARAQVSGGLPECDLVVKGVWDGESRGALRLDDDSFQTDRRGERLSLQQLKDLGRQDNHQLTFTCVPPNSGVRIGIDRNLDGILDGD